MKDRFNICNRTSAPPCQPLFPLSPPYSLFKKRAKIAIRLKRKIEAFCISHIIAEVRSLVAKANRKKETKEKERSTSARAIKSIASIKKKKKSSARINALMNLIDIIEFN